MLISTKGRYALRVMLDLAVHRDEGFISLKTIAQRQGTSVKYSEALISLLCREGFVLSTRGKEGGYKLTKPDTEYTVGSILRATEGVLAPVSCLETTENTCPRAKGCLTLPMWRELDRIIEKYLDSITLHDLICKNVSADTLLDLNNKKQI